MSCEMAKTINISSSDAMLALGQQLAANLSPMTIYLIGQLGAGKTTLTRGILRGLGHTGKVKSPTYNIVEHYEQVTPIIEHFDLYRMTSPEELELMGIRDFSELPAVLIFEWPENGGTCIPAADLVITIEMNDNARRVIIEGKTAKGLAVF